MRVEAGRAARPDSDTCCRRGPGCATRRDDTAAAATGKTPRRRRSRDRSGAAEPPDDAKQRPAPGTAKVRQQKGRVGAGDQQKDRDLIELAKNSPRPLAALGTADLRRDELHRFICPGLEKIEIATFVRLQNVLLEQVRISSQVFGRGSFEVPAALFQVLLGDDQVEPPVFQIQFNPVAVADKCKRSADGRLWSNVENHRSVGGPAHA